MCGSELVASSTVFCTGFMMSGKERRKCRWQGREIEGGRERVRCVVALIWSAILVSANQGLPVLRGALEFTFPSTAAAKHTHTLTHACNDT